ncbi:MAG: ATP:cob(I)alamin adenosyltransferase [Azoarcus sp.]|jgi:cob(I)alamin adenosyltransferase|nr:ATP:cob(I)alamin adenosyltransferase [Azoarcus sp.]
MKPGKDFSELCYTYIYDTTWLCDYEVTTDELCAQLGMAYSHVEQDDKLADIAPDLARLQALALHANGSIRAKMAVEADDLAWLHTRYSHYCAEVEGQEPGRLKHFILPRGTDPVPQLHQARSTAKKAIRYLVRVEQDGRTIPPEIPRLLNLMCNFCFLLTVVVNQRRQVREPIFVSKSYVLKR